MPVAYDKKVSAGCKITIADSEEKKQDTEVTGISIILRDQRDILVDLGVRDAPKANQHRRPKDEIAFGQLRPRLELKPPMDQREQRLIPSQSSGR